jgi:4-hydroxybenzoate polyprenyltransferase
MIFLETVQSGLALATFPLGFWLSAHNLRQRFRPLTLGWANSRRSVAAVVVQLFFAYRIWVLSNKKLWWLCLTISFVSPLYVK